PAAATPPAPHRRHPSASPASGRPPLPGTPDGPRIAEPVPRRRSPSPSFTPFRHSNDVANRVEVTPDPVEGGTAMITASTPRTLAFQAPVNRIVRGMLRTP